MAGGPYFDIGMVVKCTTCHDETIQGEVVAFDLGLKSLFLKSTASNGKPDMNDIKCVNLSYVSDINVIKEAPCSSTGLPSLLPNLNLQKLNTRRKANIEEKMKKINYVGSGVTDEAQELFDTILKTIPDVEWDGEKILVMKNVVISPPYQVEDCQLTDSHIYQNGQTLTHVKKIVKKFRDDHKERASTVSSSSSSSPPA